MCNQTERPKRVTMVCAHCGCDDVTCDATARWDIALQTWVLSIVRPEIGTCEQCGGETRLQSRPDAIAESLAPRQEFTLFEAAQRALWYLRSSAADPAFNSCGGVDAIARAVERAKVGA